MGRFSYGPATAHILASRGSELSRLHFYSTSYSTSYGRDGFFPRTTKHCGTGYLANFRPAIYYSRNIDELDNPLMGRTLSHEYGSLAKKHFQPSVGPHGKETIPKSVHMVKSGFVKEFPVTRPMSSKVKEPFVDTRQKGIVERKAVPYLKTVGPKDPVGRENAGHGAGYMTTEQGARFLGEPSERADTSAKTVGSKEGSGFTHATNIEPITYHPSDAFVYLHPNYRPTGTSVMRQDYRANQLLQGSDHFHNLTTCAQGETGYTNGNRAKPLFTPQTMDEGYSKQSDLHPMVQDRIRKKDPAEWANITTPNNHFSLTQTTFHGQQRPSPSQAEKLRSKSMGRKELTGFSENHDRYVEQAQTQYDLDRFTTHHSNCFWDKNPQGNVREGHTKGRVLPQSMDGFTKSTAVHGKALGNEQQSSSLLRSLNPYQAKSIKRRDPLFDDHTHDAKLH